MKNIDKVRKMSAEELLELFFDPMEKIRDYSADDIVSYISPQNCPPDVECGELSCDCDGCWIEWLNREAEE